MIFMPNYPSGNSAFEYINMNQKRVIITGATGVIGMALIDKCIEEGIKVYALVNPDSNRIGRIEELTRKRQAEDYVKIIRCGIDEYSMIDSNSLGINDGDIEVFYHLAWGGTYGNARNDATLQGRNIEYTLDAVKLAHRLNCKCFVGVGSQAEYGRVDGNVKLTGNLIANPENEYGKAKLEAGIRSRKLCNELGIRHIWTRVLSIYGPYDGVNTLITSTIRKLLNGEVPSLTPGEQVWDYLYSKDAARALILLGENGVDGKVYPIGSGNTRLLREYLEILRDSINPLLKLGLGDIPYFDKQVMYLCADISELTEDTGFEPEISFEEGIKETIDWNRECLTKNI